MEGGKSSANSYWPGFVDALTNVVIAMIFIVVVLAIALSFAAQQMGQKLADEYIKKIQAEQAASASAAPAAANAAPEAVPPRSAQKADVRIAVAAPPPQASAPTATSIRQTGGRLQLDYAPNAFMLDSASQARLLQSLAATSPTGPRRVELVAVGPGMSLSDSQRGAYVRLMSVRNALIEMGYTADQILTRIDTTQSPPTPSIFVVLPE